MESGQLIVTIGANIDKLREETGRAHELLEHFGEQATEIAGLISGAFAAEKVAEFSFEVSELAGKAAGLKNAFREIPNAAEVMKGLKESTHETANEMNLMGLAIHANNLNIPLQDLNTLLEFAHVRAVATNQDFNTLAETLITAIGKGGTGAKRAMAELQISTEDYNRALKETGNTTQAVMLLAKESIENSKGSMDKTLLSIEQSKAAWDDLKVSVGEFLNKSEVLAGWAENITLKFRIFGQENVAWWEKIIISASSANDELKEYLADKQKAILGSGEDRTLLNILEQIKKKRESDEEDKKNALDLGTIDGLHKKITEELKLQGTAKGINLIRINEELDSYRQQLKVLENIRTINNNMGNGSVGLKDNSAFSKQKDDLEKSMREISAIMPKLTGDANMNMKKVWHDNLQELKKNQAEARKEYLETAKAAQIAGAEMADAFVGVVAGQESLAQGLSKVASTIINDMMKRAIAAQMAKTAESAPPFVAIALMAAAAAAISALFSSIGGSEHAGGGGGGGGESSSAGSRYADSGQAGRAYYANNPMAINLNANLSVNGTGLSAVIRKQTYLTKITGG